MSVRVGPDITICFRVDASQLIGTGHVMRCLTLARELRGRGATCIFVCREHPGHLGGLIAQQEFEVRLLAGSSDKGSPDTDVNAEGEPLHSHWIGATWLQDARETAALLEGRKIDWLVVDHYGLDRRWEEALRPHCHRIFVIDDLADRPHACDLLLDQNIVGGMQTRYEGLVPAHCCLLLGPHHALLQPEYGELHDRVPPREGAVRRVLVYFGGADARNLTGMAVDAFVAIEAPEVTLDVVINPAGPHADAIRGKAASDARIALHEQLPSLAPLMVAADLAIGASGATTWERLCLGLPTLVVTLAVNQVPIAEELDRQGLIRWLGDAGEMDADRLRVALAEALAEPLPETWSQACAKAVDGQGLARVAQHLLLGPTTPLREAIAHSGDVRSVVHVIN
jgi:UDP-2,4-diacetamido-2,4,6-trideoxy-beta-L-altropyranose hydrolase